MTHYSEEAAADQAREISMNEAMREWRAHRDQQLKKQEQEECPHDEHDHGICLDCGKDCFDDLLARADYMRED